MLQIIKRKSMAERSGKELNRKERSGKERSGKELNRKERSGKELIRKEKQHSAEDKATATKEKRLPQVKWSFPATKVARDANPRDKTNQSVNANRTNLEGVKFCL
jgi:hypothetical protein